MNENDYGKFLVCSSIFSCQAIADIRIPSVTDLNHKKFHADPLPTFYAFS